MAQVAPLSEAPEKGRGKKGGLRAATREIGVERTDAQRALKIGSISPEAKQDCRDAGLANNQSALLKIAGAPIEEQRITVRRIITEKNTPPARPPAVEQTLAFLRERLGSDFLQFRELMRGTDPSAFRKAVLED